MYVAVAEINRSLTGNIGCFPYIDFTIPLKCFLYCFHGIANKFYPKTKIQICSSLSEMNSLYINPPLINIYLRTNR